MKKLLLIITSLLFNINLVWGQGMPGFGPFADPVTVSGTLEVGEILTGSYEYFDPNMTDESGSTYQWYRYDDEYGSGRTAISGAESQTYTLVAADDGKYIRFEVTPSNGTETGAPTESQAVGPIGGSSGESGNTTPVASNVAFTGTLQVGETLTGSYDYSDDDGDLESGSIYIWYRIEGMSKSPIGGADSQTYTLVEADEGKNISFAVIPSDGIGAGSEEESSAQGPVLAASTPPTISYAGGTGTEADPYQVETLEQLQAIKDSPSYHYVLNNDIDASATSTWNSGEGFVPIGGDTPFTGSFDGQGYVITGLTMNRPTEDYVGLFAVIGDGGAVKDIGLEQLWVTGGGNTGGLVGENNGTISGSYADGAVEGSAVVGGLVGLNNSSITESYSAGTVDGTQDIGGLIGLHSLGTVSKSYSASDATGIADNVGGLVGFSYDNIENSYATGSVNGDTNVGGLVGNYNSGTATNSYSTGSVTGSSNIGGFIGQKYSFAAATNSFWDTQTSGQASATGIGSTTGISGKTTTEMQTESTFTGAGWDFTDIWVMSGYPSLQAFVGNTAPVVTNAVADIIVDEDNAIDDISLTDVFSDNEDNDADLTYLLVSNNNNSLVSISVDNSLDILELLLQSNANGTSDITIQAEDSEGLTVQESFTITVAAVNDDPTGTVTIAGTAKEDETLTVSNDLADADGLGSISYQWQRDGMDISGATNSTYTLVQADVGAVITVIASYTDGEGTSESVTSAGTDSVILNNTAPIASNAAISGNPKTGETIAATYDFEDADGDANAGASFQWYRSVYSEYEYGYVESMIDGATDSLYTVMQADKFEQLRVEITPNDGTENGSMVTSGYIVPSPFEGGNGTSEDPFLIATADQLDEIRNIILETDRNYLREYFKLVADIDLDVAPYNTGKGWVPLARSGGAINEKFFGHFDGDNHTISGLFINSSDYYYMGMFGFTDGGSISNLIFEDVNITDTDAGNIGTLGYVSGTKVTNVHVTGSVTGGQAGGIAGSLWNSGSISNSSFIGTVSGSGSAGGISSDIESDEYDNTYISKSFSAGTVSGYNAGGITGTVSEGGTISDSYSAATVTGTSSDGYAGGIVARSSAGIAITNSYAFGIISGAGITGGISGNGYVFATNIFWDVVTTTQDSALNEYGIAKGIDGATGLSTSAMKDSLTFANAGWDFENTWAIATGDSVSYPYLQSNPQTPVPGKVKANKVPVASNVAIAGTLAKGEELAATYDYSDTDGDANAGAAFQWYRADDEFGTNEVVIEDATDSSYVSTMLDAGKYVKVSVSPNDGTAIGTAVSSSWAYIPPVFLLAENGVTVTCLDASPGDEGILNGITYKALSEDSLRARVDAGANVTNVCTSLITDMSELFKNKSSFNQDIGDWDVSSVTGMGGMFAYAQAFNQDIGDWDVGSVTDMVAMFSLAQAFNQNLGDWDVSSVTRMRMMFFSASAFNQDIGDWDVSSVTNMSGLFSEASAFDQDLSGWDVSSVTNMNTMFYSAQAFNQNLADWDISSVTDAEQMLRGSALTTTNYDALLNGWSQQSVQNNVLFGVGEELQYTSAASAARDILTDTYGWGITDGGRVNSALPVASNVAIAGNLKLNAQVAATYDYSDEDGDANAGAAFQWYRIVDEAGTDVTPINGATDSLYTLTEEDMFKYLRVEVTPFDGFGYGESIASDKIQAFPFEGGSGTAADPFLISTAEQLNAIRDVKLNPDQPNNITGHFKLINDIDLTDATRSGGAFYNDGAGWQPLGENDSWNITDSFNGVLDGDGHTIDGVFINRTGNYYDGFFGFMEGTVRNLHFTNVDITARSGLVGRLIGDLENVHMTGTVTGTGTLGGEFSFGTVSNSSFNGTLNGNGGLIGYSNYGASIINSYSTGYVSGNGGLVGTMAIDSYIRNSYSTASVSSGGLIGSASAAEGAETGIIENSFAFGTVRDDGGIAGETYYSFPNISGVFWDVETTGQDSASSSMESIDGATGLSTIAMKDSLTFANAGWDFENTWAIATGDSVSYPYLQANPQSPAPGKESVNEAPVATNAAISGYPKTGETIAATYDFSDADGDANAGAIFQWYRKEYGEYESSSEAKIDGATDSTYIVTSEDNYSDLRVEIVPFDGNAYGDKVYSGYVKASPFEGGSGVDGDPFLIATVAQLDSVRNVQNSYSVITGHFKLISDLDLDIAPYNEGKGWIPFARSNIGISELYSGHFDGDGHVISGLYINSGDYNFMGMFGFVDGGSISNVTFTDVDITGLGGYTSPLGYISGAAVSNVHVTGTVSGTEAGGIAGALWNGGSITESSFTGTVSGTNAGGISGNIESEDNSFGDENTNISKSFSAGTVSGENAGGIVGSSTRMGTITDSYSLAEVSGTNSAGGIIGNSEQSITITNSYAIGPVSGSGIAGAISGIPDDRYSFGAVNANNIFWDVTTTGQSQAYPDKDTDGATGLSSVAMKDSLSFANAGWDFENTWAIATGDSVSYPYLQANQQNPKPGIELNNTAPVFAQNRLSPKPDTTGVAVDALISAASEEAVSALDLDNVTIKDEDEANVSGVSASLTENVLTIAHDRFKPFTKYTITIPRGTVQNAEEVSNSAISWSFTTGIDLTLATTLVSPADEATDVDLKPTFKWNTLQGVSGYELMGSLNENFSDSMVVKGITDTTYTLLNELEMGVIFHWRVRGTTDSDSTAWSEPFSFTTTQPNELFTTVDRVTWDDNGTETDVCSDGVNVGEETTVWITITDNTGKVYTDSDSEILEAYIPGANIGAGSDVLFVYDNESGLWKASFPMNVLGTINYMVNIPSISNLKTPEAEFEACLTTFVTDGTFNFGYSSAIKYSFKTSTSETAKSKQKTAEPFILGLQRLVDDGTGKQVRDTLKVVIDWGDETIEYYEGVGYPSHVYTEAEDYKIRVAGNHNSFKASAANKQISGLTSVSNWGEAKWKDLSNAFEGAVNLNVTAEDSPDLTDVKSLKQMFKGARSFNADIGNWNVSQITNMASMFQGAKSFNQDISSWDVSKVQFFDVASALSAKQVGSSQGSIAKEKGSGETENSGATEIDPVSGKLTNGRAVTGKPAVNTPDTQEKSKLNQNTSTAAQTDSISGFLVGSGLSSANASKMVVGWKDKINTTVQSINIGNIELDALGAAALKEVQQATGIQFSWGGQEGVDDEPVFSSLPNPFKIATEDTRILKLWEYVSDPSTSDNQLEFTFDIISDSVETVSFDNLNGELAITARADADTFFVAIQVANMEGITSLDTLEVQMDPSFTTSSELMAALPKEMELNQNYPNPFNPTTVIRYGVPQSSKVRLEVFDMLGRKVATLVNNEQQNAGWHQVNFDASRLASGMYLYRIVAGKHVQTRKMLLIK